MSAFTTNVITHDDANEPGEVFYLHTHIGLRQIFRVPVGWFSWRWSQPCIMYHGKPIQCYTRHLPWPHYQEFDRRIGTRLLVKVYPFDVKFGVEQFVQQMFDESLTATPNYEVTVHASALYRAQPHINLPIAPEDQLIPSTWIESSEQMSAAVTTPCGIRKVFQLYVLASVCEVLAVLTDVPPTMPFKFYDVSRNYSAHRAAWDVYSLEQKFHIIYVDPDCLSKDDMHQMSMAWAPLTDGSDEVAFNPGDLDSPYAGTNGKGGLGEIYKTLWALAYDVCAPPNGNAFAITNYNYWQFGYFTPNRTSAHITCPVKASIDCHRSFDGRPGFKRGVHDANALQMLVFWIQAARGQTPVQFGADDES